MKKNLLAILAIAILTIACSNNDSSNIAGPSPIGAILQSIKQLAQSTIAVLDGTVFNCAGGCTVTKYPNHPAEPPSPTYFVRTTGPDPCTAKWPGYETNYLIDHDDNYLTPNIHWCQPND